MTRMVAAAPPAHVVTLPGGASEASFVLRRPAGVILRFRITVPHGSLVVVDGKIGIAGVRNSTRRASCSRHGAVDVCDQPEEWCPMPAAAWRFTVKKLSGRAGPIAVDFVVAPPPA
jgi:hypothetical protein